MAEGGFDLEKASMSPWHISGDHCAYGWSRQPLRILKDPYLPFHITFPLIYRNREAHVYLTPQNEGT